MTPPRHLFVLHADLTRLACDAWLLPTDRFLQVERPWRPVLQRHYPDWPAHGVTAPQQHAAFTAYLTGLLPEEWGGKGTRVLRLAGWPADEPEPVLTNVGGVKGTPAEWYAEGARQFLDSVRQSGPHDSRFRRARPLVALPLVGAGFGMAHAGRVLNALFHLFHAEIKRDPAGPDVALVLFSPEHYAAAQHRREAANFDWWPDLDDAHREHTQRLAATARSGDLALFLGAGVSANAGLPTWGELLDRLAARLNEAGRPLDLIALKRVSDPLEQAAVLEHSFGGPRPLQQAVVEELRTRERGGQHAFYSLQHGLLASLPAREAVTTNYDQLYEAAKDATMIAGSPGSAQTRVLPYQSPQAGCPWLLKLHGSLDQPADIVLTRDSFIGYGQARAALAGLVQGLLLTRHVLFVGFSLTDYNFLRISHDVRHLLRSRLAEGDPGQRYATAVLPDHNPLLQQVWQGDMYLVPFDVNFPEAARQVEIFLDCLAACVGADAHLLAPDFADLLEKEDRYLADELHALAQNHPLTDGGGRLLRRLAEALSRLGMQ
jgi:hypothetical protein